MLELTEQQRQALAEDENPTVIDPQTGEEYVLVRKRVYDRVRGLMYDGGDWTHEELRAQLARSATANGWDEPEMAAYDGYDENKPCR